MRPQKDSSLIGVGSQGVTFSRADRNIAHDELVRLGEINLFYMGNISLKSRAFCLAKED